MKSCIQQKYNCCIKLSVFLIVGCLHVGKFIKQTKTHWRQHKYLLRCQNKRRHSFYVHIRYFGRIELAALFICQNIVRNSHYRLSTFFYDYVTVSEYVASFPLHILRNDLAKENKTFKLWKQRELKKIDQIFRRLKGTFT